MISLVINILDVLELWDDPHVQLSDRSRLNHLEPVGINTSDVECFTSYLARLAASHHVTVLSLVQKEIIPFLPRSSCGHNHHDKILYGPYTRVLNGLESRATHWVATLEALTLRKDLSLLTMLRWHEVLPQNGTMRRERAWCPSCYQEWRIEDKIVFDPLIWSIKPVEICTRHKRMLVNRCPYCGKTLPFLGSHYRVGHCSRCMKWLGDDLNETIPVNNLYKKGYVKWQRWLSNNIGELLALPLGSFSPNRERVARTLKAFSRKAPRQSMLGFAEWLRVPAHTVFSWCNGDCLPRLSSLLYVCHHLGITLLELFTKDNVVKELEMRAPYFGTKYNTRVTYPRDKEAIRRSLEAVLVSEEVPPPSLLTVSKQLGIDAWDLRKMFPELCKRISEKHKQHRSAYWLKKLKLICEDVKRISLELHSEGIEPTRGRLSVRMKKSGYFRSKEVEHALLAIRRKLGYETY